MSDDRVTLGSGVAGCRLSSDGVVWVDGRLLGILCRLERDKDTGPTLHHLHCVMCKESADIRIYHQTSLAKTLN